MSRVRVGGFSISLDGFGAGPEQSLEHPLGLRGRELHQWMFGTRFFHTMIGEYGDRSTDPRRPLLAPGGRSAASLKASRVQASHRTSVSQAPSAR